MDTEIRISILIPVFNGENYLSQTIQSILTKTQRDIVEIIVINDGSTDATEQICLKYEREIKYLSQVNQGEYAATNTGLNHAHGKYVMVVSHDDPMLSAELIPLAIEVLEKNDELVCVYPDWQIINAEGDILSQKIVAEFSELELIGKFNCLPGPGAVFRKDTALKIGGRRKWKFVSDYDFWLRLSQLGKFKRIPGVRAQWRSHQNSTTVSMKSFDMAQERIAVIEGFLSTHQIEPRIARMGKSSAYYFAARLGVFSNRIPAKKWMLVSFVTRRRWPEVAKLSIVIFILLLPASKVLLKFVRPLSKRLRDIF